MTIEEINEAAGTKFAPAKRGDPSWYEEDDRRLRIKLINDKRNNVSGFIMQKSIGIDKKNALFAWGPPVQVFTVARNVYEVKGCDRVTIETGLGYIVDLARIEAEHRGNQKAQELMDRQAEKE